MSGNRFGIGKGLRQVTHQATHQATLVAIVSAAMSAYIIMLLARRFAALSDPTSGGPQKFHALPTPRVGGVAVFAGIVCGAAYSSVSDPSLAHWWVALLLVAQPAFLAGLAEDITKQVGVKTRLTASFTAALIGVYWLGARITHLDVAGLDSLLAIGWFSVLFTMFAVGGVAHAINLIDGYNGLSGMVGVLILCGVATVAAIVGDGEIFVSSVVLAGSLIGFLVWNFPRGHIFIGDGGAYLIGILTAVLMVLLVSRNPGVSPWLPLLLAAYPVWETLFSSYRRLFLQRTSLGDPDALHLHHLIYSRLVRWQVGSKNARHVTTRNSLTAPYLCLITLVSVIVSVLFWNDSLALKLGALVFAVSYVWFYWRLVRFRSPRWMIVRSGRVVGIHNQDEVVATRPVERGTALKAK